MQKESSGSTGSVLGYPFELSITEQSQGSQRWER